MQWPAAPGCHGPPDRERNAEPDARARCFALPDNVRTTQLPTSPAWRTSALWSQLPRNLASGNLARCPLTGPPLTWSTRCKTRPRLCCGRRRRITPVLRKSRLALYEPSPHTRPVVARPFADGKDGRAPVQCWPVPGGAGRPGAAGAQIALNLPLPWPRLRLLLHAPASFSWRSARRPLFMCGLHSPVHRRRHLHSHHARIQAR